MAPDTDDEPVTPQPTSRWRSLSVRVAGLLTLALLPIGLIAIVQSIEAIRTAQENFRASLSGQTFAAALPEGAVISEMVRRAEGLALAMPAIVDDPDACVTVIDRIIDDMPDLSFAGFTTPDLMSDCNSTGQPLDFRDNDNVQVVLAKRESGVDFVPQGQVSRQAIVVVTEPVFDDQGTFLGVLTMSYPRRSLDDIREEANVDDDVTLVTFSDSGEILTSRRATDEILAQLPIGRTLQDLAVNDQQAFTAQDTMGVWRDYAVLPIAPDRAFALGMRNSPRLFGTGWSILVGTLLLPLLMWAISLIVAVLALRRLVIAPIQTLRMRMLNFADGRTVFRANSLRNAPRELHEIGATFERIAEGVVRDEALMEDQLHERGMLLREVHHRVKNNLQMMSSIVNMQIRRSKATEAVDALTQVKGRLASLAKFHQDLYSSSSLAQLRADEVLEELVRQMFNLATHKDDRTQLHFDLEQVVLPPEQVGPLAMLATEAVTNAIKYSATDSDQPAEIGLTMRIVTRDGKDICEVVLENTVPPGHRSDPPDEGLGTRLMLGFALQLNAEMTQKVEGQRFVLEVSFERVWPAHSTAGTEDDAQALGAQSS